MKTRVTELFGIKHPIMCGGMYRLADPQLCAAISNAGAMGNLTSAYYQGKDALRTAIQQVRELTDKPFLVNVTMLPSERITEDDYKNQLDVIVEEKVPAVEIGGMPLSRFAGGEYLKKLKDAGIKLIHKVGVVRHAQHVEKAGYDAVFAAGVEEGGHPHPDNVATTVLTIRMAEELKIPVITAGGMATGRGLAAALCLGAEGIMMASRFICTHECNVHDNVRQELIRRQENETTLYGNKIGLQGRALRNDTMKKFVELEDKGAGLDELIPMISGAHGDEIWERGNTNVGSLNVGQSIGLIHDTVSCQELVDRIVREAEEVLSANVARF